MSDTLLIHYNIENKNHASWALCNNDGELTSKISSGSLTDLQAISTTHIPVVLLNSQCLHINELQLPTQNMQKMLKAIPYAIEEFIADDIENFHFVASNASNNNTCVVGIDKTTLRNITETFQEANIFIEKIIPDALCLNANEQQWAALNFQDHSYLQTNKLNGMMVYHDVFPYILESNLSNENTKNPEKIFFFSETENNSAFDSISIDSLTSDNSNIEQLNISYNNHPLVIFCENYTQALPLNLLQHEFKTKSKSSGYWKHWRLAATLAATWLLLHLGVTTFQYQQLKEENTITKNKIEKIYKTAFPKSRKINNPRRQMEQKIKELKSASGNTTHGLLFMLEEAFSGLTQETKDITFQSFTFRNNRMDIGLDSKNLQAIENLNKKLNTNSNIKSEIVSSSSEKDIVKGNLRIEGHR